jgi:16S rRNA (cytidine1402-2'-O)-methyltransferase
MSAPTLFLVATPIGNLEDITLRALRVLRSVSLVAAEDTRRTAKLLSHFDIHTPTTSFYEQVEREKTPRLIGRLAAGDSLALVSDAGTPGISDPGYRLARAAIDAGFRVEAIPGASSVLTALVASGLPTSTFSFVGFPPPRAQARDRWLADVCARRETIVFFEAPHRVRATLEAILRVAGDLPVAVGRELTKVHEELIRGTVSSALGQLTEERGEFTIVLAPAAPEPRPAEPLPSSDRLLAMFGQMTNGGDLSRREAIGQLAERYGMSSREIYRAVEDAKNSVE